MRTVWPDAVVEENNLTVNVSALRKALGETPGERRYLVTVPGRGYQFVAEVRQAAPVERVIPEETPPVKTSTTASAAATGRGVRWPVVLGVLFVAAMVGGYVAVWRSSPGRGKADNRSVAILPLTNAGNDPDAEYLSDGITEGLIDSLSQLPGVKVIARTSAFRYKGSEVDAKEVARTLGVEAVVTGRVTRRGESLSISVELINASDATRMWGEQYDRKATDLRALQSEISAAIAEQLRLSLGRSPRPADSVGVNVDPRAYELMLRGRFYFNKGSGDARTKAVDYFLQAIAVDSNYAAVHAELADAYSLLGHDGAIDQREAAHKAEAAALRALELDEGLPEAHRALAYTRQLAWDWTGAEREYGRAIELNPSYAEARANYSSLLGLMGRHGRAIAEARRARELDPMSLRINAWVFTTLLCARQYDQALDVVERMRELDPHHPQTLLNLGYVRAASGRYSEAVAAFKEVMERGDHSTSTRIYLGYAHARAGQRGEAHAILAGLQGTKEPVSAAELAILYAGLGERDRAFQSLEEAYSAHDAQLQYLGVDTFLDSLRSDPRFESLLRRIGLPR